MIPYWVFSILILSHVGLFVLGALAYHGIRMLAVRPIYGAPPQQKAGTSEARIQAMATKIAQKQAADALFGHLGPMDDVPMAPRQQVIPEGDGRPAKEDAFAPMAKR